MSKIVLTVDDSRTMREMLMLALSNAGYRVVQAEDGMHGLEVLKDARPDVIITDINMPRMDGLQLLAAVKAAPEWRHLPVVMITTEGGETKVAEALRLGAAGYVRKPFTGDQIKEKLVGILEPALKL